MAAGPGRRRAAGWLRWRRILIALIVAGGGFMTGLDGTIVATALPQIGTSLAESPLRLSLTVSGYLLSVAVFTPLSGWVADRFGIRRGYGAALAVFIAGSLLCGLAGNLATLLLARLVQGAGGGLLGPLGQLILLRSFRKDAFVSVNGYVVIAGLVGPLVAPLLGGLLVTYLSWRWIFYINLPFGLIELALAVALLGGRPERAPARFDRVGFLLLALGLALLQGGLEAAGRRLIPGAAVAGLLAAAGAALAAYARHASRQRDPLIDLRLLRIRAYAVSIFGGGLSIMGIAAVGFLLPLLFQIGFGLDAIQSGARTFVSTLAIMTVRGLLPPLLRRLGFRTLLSANAFLLALGIAGFALIEPGTPLWAVVAYIFLFGMLRSFHWSNANALGYAELPPALLSRSTGFTALANQMAQSLGVGVSALLLAAFGAGGRDLSLADFRLAFVLVGAIAMLSLLGFLRLEPEDGARFSRRRAAPAHAPSEA